MKPRLGHIEFINCLPLTYALTYGGYQAEVAVTPSVPAVLNQMVVAGQLDVSPVSSIIYAQHSAKLVILPEVSISANGALQSILLVSKYPIAELRTASIALTAKSATSHVLLKAVMKQAYQATPEYFISGQTVEEGVLDKADAVLLIGDDALKAYHHRQPGYYYYDMGDEWKKLTGLGMVYAVWVVNRNFAQANLEQVDLLQQRVTQGFAYGLTHLQAAAATLAGKMPFSKQQIIDYIHLLNYQFTPEHAKALHTFYSLAQDVGAIEKIPELSFAKVGAYV